MSGNIGLRALPAATVGAALALAAVGCGGSGSGSSASGSTSSSVKVAVIPPASGPLVTLGSSMLRGWEYAAAAMNAKGGLGGHELDLVKTHTDGTPAASTRAARNAVAQGARFVTGTVTSAETAAIQTQLGGLGALDLNTSASDSALTGESCSPDAFHFIPNTVAQVDAVGSVVGSLPAKRYAIMVYDYSTGHTAAAAISQAVRDGGGQVVKTLYVPIETTDFGSYISQIKSSGADGFFGMISGSGSATFLKQAKQFKLLDQLKVRLGYSMVSDINWDGIGEAATGFYDSQIYDPALDNARNKAFVAGFQKQYGHVPNYDEANAYLAAEVLQQSVEEAKSTDPKAVKAAMASGTFDTIMGSVKFAPSHTLEREWYVGQVTAKSGGGFAWKVVKKNAPAGVVPAGVVACGT
jgi:ABC-type branched-subunit amino acid transport system substrate-binding protein